MISFDYRGEIISIYGESGSGKTILMLDSATKYKNSLYISTEGKEYQARVVSIPKINSTFSESSSYSELAKEIVTASLVGYELIIIDTINHLYRINRNYREFSHILQIIKSFSISYGINFLLGWQVSMNYKVSGGKIMLFYSDKIFKIEKKFKNRRYIVTEDGNKYCFEIKVSTITGC
ncbi:AAA family ATPase [Sulfolobales archaeon HS-7]|nr:AAA family ATPase [Sulfolobales archaeon HS-7]